MPQDYSRHQTQRPFYRNTKIIIGIKDILKLVFNLQCDMLHIRYFACCLLSFNQGLAVRLSAMENFSEISDNGKLISTYLSFFTSVSYSMGTRHFIRQQSKLISRCHLSNGTKFRVQILTTFSFRPLQRRYIVRHLKILRNLKNHII